MKILNVLIDNVIMQEAVSRIASMVKNGKKNYVVTPNAEFLVDAQKDREFRNILNSADLAIPDGMGLIYASRLYGVPLAERVAGTDLVDQLCRQAAEDDWTVFFLGGLFGVGEKAAEKLSEKYSGLNVCGFYEGKREKKYDEETIQEIKNIVGDQEIDVLFVAYGHRNQEKWIARNLGKLDVSVAVGVGGAFDFISGYIPRAPFWMRNAGLEWLFRLVQQPWRWKRIFKAVVIFPLLIAKDITNANRGK